MILAVEGIDGCGKTSVVAAVINELTQRHGYRARRLAFPDRETVTGRVLDAHLRATVGAPGWLDPYTHQALQVVNRCERLPELRDETWINVLSRYTPSAFVYGRLDGCERQWLERVTSALPPADLNVLLAVRPAVAWQRMHERGVTSDAYERRGVTWFEEAAECYEGLWISSAAAEGYPRWVILEASHKTPHELAEVIVNAFLTMFDCPCGKLHNAAKTPHAPAVSRG